MCGTGCSIARNRERGSAGLPRRGRDQAGVPAPKTVTCSDQSSGSRCSSRCLSESPGGCRPAEDRPLQLGRQEGEPQQPPMIGRGRDRLEHRASDGIARQHRVRGAQRPDQHRVGPGRRIGRADDHRPAAVQLHPDRQHQPEQRRVLPIGREFLAVEQPAVHAFRQSCRQQQVHGVRVDLDARQQIERVGRQTAAAGAAARSAAPRAPAPEPAGSSRRRPAGAAPAAAAPRHSSGRTSCGGHS